MAKTNNLSIQHYASDMLERFIDDDRINELASEYQTKHVDVSEAAKSFVNDHSKQANCLAIIEQVTSFINIPEFAGASVGFLGLLYYQLYIVCGVAAIAGKNIHSNEVKTQCIECLTVNVVARACRTVVSKAASAIFDKYKLKGLEKGVEALAEFVLDWSAIKIVSNRAYKAFIAKDK